MEYDMHSFIRHCVEKYCALPASRKSPLSHGKRTLHLHPCSRGRREHKVCGKGLSLGSVEDDQLAGRLQNEVERGVRREASLLHCLHRAPKRSHADTC